MKKRSLILIGVVIIILILSMVSLSKNGGKSNLPQPTPTRVPRPTINFTSDTGAKYIPPTDEEYLEIIQIAELRKKSPIEDESFTISYNYKTNRFEVVMAKKSDREEARFLEWLKGNGYGNISDKYFVFK